MVRVLFVCLGNICRSPLAEGVFRRMVLERGLGDQIEVDSVGTGAWHVGEPPDRRMQAVAQSRGVSLSGLRSRKVERADLDRFDYVFAMDRQNRQDLLALDPRRPHEDIHLFRSFDPIKGVLDVPDPYYEGRFDEVFDIVDRTSRAILDYLVEHHELGSKNEEPADNESDGGTT